MSLLSLLSASRNLRIHKATSFFHRLGRISVLASTGRQFSSDNNQSGFLMVPRAGVALGADERYKLTHFRVPEDEATTQDVRCSMWLAYDRIEKKNVRLESIREDCLGPSELAVYQQLSLHSPTISSSPHCVSLLDHFTHAEPTEVCLITDLMGGDLTLLQENWPCMMHFPLVKRILLHVLRGIAYMHRRGVVHTDLSPKNILFDASRLGINDISRSPHPIVYLDDAMNSTYLVSDFTNAQFISELGDANEGTDQDYRPPEVILRGPWNEKVDIWAFGCLLFELSVATKLFRRLPHSTHCHDADECHLWQIQVMTGETFNEEQLEESADAPLYFDEYNNLKSDPPKWREPFDRCLSNYNLLKKGDLDMTVALLERCLRIDPDDRATAEELLQDPFWNDVE